MIILRILHLEVYFKVIVCACVLHLVNISDGPRYPLKTMSVLEIHISDSRMVSDISVPTKRFYPKFRHSLVKHFEAVFLQEVRCYRDSFYLITTTSFICPIMVHCLHTQFGRVNNSDLIGTSLVYNEISYS